jgi:hypothetical protein
MLWGEDMMRSSEASQASQLTQPLVLRLNRNVAVNLPTCGQEIRLRGYATIIHSLVIEIFQNRKHCILERCFGLRLSLL